MHHSGAVPCSAGCAVRVITALHAAAQLFHAPLQLLVIHISGQVNHLPIADGILPPAGQDCVQVDLALHEDVIIPIIAVSCCCCCCSCSCSTRAPSGCTASKSRLLRSKCWSTNGGSLILHSVEASQRPFWPTTASITRAMCEILHPGLLRCLMPSNQKSSSHALHGCVCLFFTGNFAYPRG